MKSFLLSVILFFCLPPTHAQTTLDDYRCDVTEYSRRLKVAAAGSDAAAETVGQARTGYLPRLSLDGNFTATVHHYDGVERWNFSVLPQLVQVVYGGGAVRAAYRQAELGYDIALCDEEFTRLDVRYTAEYTYWNLSAMALYAASMRQYVSIIRSLKEVVDRRFAEGYIAKGDVLMIDTRLGEAQYELISAERNYTVALHNFNILRGADPALGVMLAQGIRDSLPQPVRVPAADPYCRTWDCRSRHPCGPCGLQSAAERRHRGIVAALLSQPHGRYDGGRLGVRETLAADIPLGRTPPRDGRRPCRTAAERMGRRATL